MALVATVLWLAGFEVLPWAHIALHDHVTPHHHDASGAIAFEATPDHDARPALDDDDRDGQVDEHAPAEPAVTSRVADARTKLAAALQHGRHSLAHHDIAVQPSPPVVTSPMPVDRHATFVVALVAIEPVSCSPGRAVARGPPRSPSG